MSDRANVYSGPIDCALKSMRSDGIGVFLKGTYEKSLHISHVSNIVRFLILFKVHSLWYTLWHTDQIIDQVFTSVHHLNSDLSGWVPAYWRLGPHTILSFMLMENLRKALGLGAI